VNPVTTPGGGTGQVDGPLDLYVGLSDTELNGFRDHDHADQIRRRAGGTLGYRLTGGTTLRLDLGFTASNERLPGGLTRAEIDRDPRQANPSSVAFREECNYDYTRTACPNRGFHRGPSPDLATLGRGGGRGPGPVRTPSRAIKAWAPDVVAVREGFLVACHEEQSPATKTSGVRIGGDKEEDR
jgi:hypothetical protein